jgi:tetratricopeptide (TPR) repeat protein
MSTKTKLKSAKTRPARAGNSMPVPALLVGILVVAGTVAYWGSFSAPFVFDDIFTIQRNAGVQFGDYLTPDLGGTRPVLYLTFALNYLAHGSSVWGYHLVNLTLHLLNGVLVFLIASNLIRRVVLHEATARTYAFLAAAFFVLHPVQTQSVTYISSRSETLSTFFYCLGVWIFVRIRESQIGLKWSLLLIVPFAVGILSKETVITFPVALLLIDFLFLSKADIRGVLGRWRFYMPFVIGGAIASYFLITRILVGSIGPGVQGQLPRGQYLVTQSKAIASYLRLVALPYGLNLDYDLPPGFDWSVIPSLILLGILIAAAWQLRNRQPVVSFGLLWFFLTLLPTSSIIPLPDTMVEHRIYLPLAGLCMVFPFVLARLVPGNEAKAGAAVLALLLIGTVQRNQVWADEIELWSDVVSKSPAKARPYNNLALAYANRARFDDAIKTFNRGLENVQGKVERRAFVEALGNIYLQLGRYPDAIDAFEKTTEVEDRKAAALAYNNMGVAYLRMLQDLELRRARVGETTYNTQRETILTQAKGALEKSMELDPAFFWPFDAYISVLFELGQADGFQPQDGNKFRTAYALGKVAMLRNDFATAAKYLKEATALNDSEKVAFLHFGFSLAQLKRFDEAATSYTWAVRIDPQYIDARENLGVVYSLQKQYAKALESFQSVLRLDANRVATHLEMAKIYIEQGDRRQARQHLTTVLNIVPQDEQARQLLQMIGS